MEERVTRSGALVVSLVERSVFGLSQIWVAEAQGDGMRSLIGSRQLFDRQNAHKVADLGLMHLFYIRSKKKKA